MTLRQLLNVTYRALCEGRDDDGLADLDYRLTAKDPSRGRSRGVDKLMAAMQLPRG